MNNKKFAPQKYVTNFTFKRNTLKSDKIVVAYLSSDFHDGHATVNLIGELFELHDRTKFDVLIYSYGAGEQII